MGDAVHPSVFVVGAALAAIVLGPCRAQLTSDALPRVSSATPRFTPIARHVDAAPDLGSAWPDEDEAAFPRGHASDDIGASPGWPDAPITPEPRWPRLTGERVGGGRRGIEILVALETETFGVSDHLEVRGLRRSAALHVLPALRDLVALYPPGLLEKAGIRRIVVAGRLARDGRRIGGVAIHRTGTIVMTSVPGLLGIETIFHHEVGHFLDRATSTGRDAEWVALNAPGTEYGEDVPRSTTLHREPGFLSTYSLKAPGEDKAELYRWLVTRPDIVAAGSADPYLQAKLDTLAARLEALDPRLDERWWRTTWTQNLEDRADRFRVVRRRR